MASVTNCCVKIDSDPKTVRESFGVPTGSKSQDRLSIPFGELIKCLERVPPGLITGAGARDPLIALALGIGDHRLVKKVQDSPMFSVSAAPDILALRPFVCVAADPTDGDTAETTQAGLAEAEAVDPAPAVVETVDAQANPAPAESSIIRLTPQTTSSSPKPAIAITPSRGASKLTPQNAPNILQFSTSIYYCKEGEDTHACIHIMRLGNYPDRCSCRYETVDDSGRSGERYLGREGIVTFEPGEAIKEVQIPVISDDHWCAVLEFMVRLSEPQGATLGKYLWSCRVKIMDDDTFPTNRFRTEIEASTPIEKLSAPKLLIEYFKMNFLHPVIRRGTIKYFIFGQVHNLYWILQLFLTKALVDDILASQGEDSYDGCQKDENLLGMFECPITTSQKEATLVTWAILLNVPFAAVHLFDFRVRFWKIGGTSRTTLQLNLLRKFFNYSEAVRNNLNLSEVTVAITRTSTELVDDGYMQLLPLSIDLSKIFFVVIIQIVLEATDALVFVAMFPLVLFCFLVVRSRKTQTALKAELDDKINVVAHVNYCSERLRILTDYVMRWFATDEFESMLKRYNYLIQTSEAIHVNNSYAAPWVGTIFLGVWFILGGQAVVHGRSSLGLFLMNMGIIKEVSSCWAKIYEVGMSLQRSFVPLQEITYLMNLPTDLEDRMKLNRKRRKKGEELRTQARKTLLEGGGSSLYAADAVPISLTDVSFRYSSGKLNERTLSAPSISNISFEFPQGSFVAIVGEAGNGKSTLLKILGGVLLPTSGDLLVPPHLRFLHISQHPMFISGTLFDNLKFSIRKNDPDGTPERAHAICRKLMLPEKICDHLDPSKPDLFNQKAEWDVVLSLSECTLLNIARAFMCNPEILILHKPTLMLNEKHAHNTIQSLRHFVDHKGLEQDPVLIDKRRPRTCIMTAARIAGVRAADKVFEVERTGVILRDKEYLEQNKSLLG